MQGAAWDSAQTRVFDVLQGGGRHGGQGTVPQEELSRVSPGLVEVFASVHHPSRYPKVLSQRDCGHIHESLHGESVDVLYYY